MLSLWLAAQALTACVARPDLGAQPVPLAPDKVAAARSLEAEAGAEWPRDSWWEGFGDPQLNAIVAEGLAGSPDIAAAAARLRRASGMAQEAGAALLPRLDAQGRLSAEKQSYSMGYPKEFVPKGWFDYGQVAGTLAFDPDLWGRNHAALAAATSEARAAEIETRQARLMLSTGIALAYANFAQLLAERDVALSAVALREATRRLVSDRMANGLETRGSLRQAEAGVATARSQLGAVDQAVAVRRNQIAALIGAGPDRGLDLARPQLAKPQGLGIPAGVTTEIFGRRPDIAAARERVQAAAGRIRGARADFFPAISISALFGLQSLGLGNLLEKDAAFGNAGAAVSLPIFHGGALKGRYTAARGGYDEAVAEYDRTVLAAYQQTADAVTGRKLVGERLADLRAALAASEEAYRIARLRYEGGLSSYLEVLQVEDRLLQARLAAAAVEGEARALDISLIRALGGGYATGAENHTKDHSHG